MEEGVIASWNVKVGDKVKSGDILAEVETDKATMDMESYEEGTILYIGVEKGEAVPIDAVIAVIGAPGEAYEHLVSGTPAPAPVASPPAAEPAAAPSVKLDTSSIAANIVRMPLLSDTMTEGVIHAWLKKIGDTVKSGDLLAEIETDKATMELEAYDEGTLLYIGAEAGKAVPVNAVIAVIGEPGADFQALLTADSAGGVATSPEPAVASPVTEAPVVPAAAAVTTSAAVAENTTSTGRILASPLAKRLAEEKGINLAEVKGSGESGRIIKSDVDQFVPSAKVAAAPTVSVAAPVAAGQESFEEIGLTQMRKAIARSLAESQSSAVDFQLTMEICMDKAIEARTIMNQASSVKISFNDMVLKACAVALTKHPAINSSWRDNHIRRNQHVHIGMAVAIQDGLVVPVIRFANTLTMSALAATTKDLGGKAKNGQLQPKDWEGNTFTVSNLGMFGIDSFTSIINNPKNESCILSVGGIKETVAVKNGQFYATNIMKITLTCDHRVVDGASGAAFLVTLKQLLEEPYTLLV